MCFWGLFFFLPEIFCICSKLHSLKTNPIQIPKLFPVENISRRERHWWNNKTYGNGVGLVWKKPVTAAWDECEKQTIRICPSRVQQGVLDLKHHQTLNDWLIVNSISLDCWSIQSWTKARPDGVFASQCPFHLPYRATNLLFCLCSSKGEELILATGRWLKPSPMPPLRAPSRKSPIPAWGLGQSQPCHRMLIRMLIV